MHRLADRAGVGGVLAAVGFCCATSLVGFAAIAGLIGTIVGFVTALGWLVGAVLLAVVSAGAATWLRSRRRQSRP
jgi:hypothetical protein